LQQQQQQSKEIAEALAEHVKLEDTAELLDQLHALDLLELELLQEPQGLPYQTRLKLLLDKISSVLTVLIQKFNTLRQKHKDFAKQSRVMWGNEVDILQQESDDLTNNLETVMDQAQFYLTSYSTYVSQLHLLTTQQHKSLVQYQLIQQEIFQTGIDYNQTTQVRSFQIKKLLEVVHYLSYGNVPYTDAIYVFGCDGIVGGNNTFDLCGICGGDNSSCADCTNNPNGGQAMDVCGVCGGDGQSCNYFCDSESDSGNITDLCGNCGGDSTICMGCDGLPNSGVVFDECSVCGGDGSSCDIGNEHHLQNFTAFVPKPGQSMIVLKCELNTSFTSSWSQNNSVTLKNLFATLSNVDTSMAQLLYIGGTNTVIFAIGVIVNEPYTVPVTKILVDGSNDGSILKTLRSQGVQGTSMTVLQGPTVFRGINTQDPSATGAQPFRFTKKK